VVFDLDQVIVIQSRVHSNISLILLGEHDWEVAIFMETFLFLSLTVEYKHTVSAEKSKNLSSFRKIERINL